MAGNEQADLLFTEYVIAHRQGKVDPVPFLDRATESEREVLATLIDAYLIDAPGREWDPAAFEGSVAQAMVAPITRALCGVSGTWPVLLPSLRNRAQIKRGELVELLADGLGYPKKSRRVAEYYHGMEQGNLPSSEVSGQVLQVLSGILGTGVSRLRNAGDMIGGGELKGGHAVFARKPSWASDPVKSIEPPALTDSDASAGMLSPAPPESRDEEDRAVDRLFTGGTD